MRGESLNRSQKISDTRSVAQNTGAEIEFIRRFYPRIYYSLLARAQGNQRRNADLARHDQTCPQRPATIFKKFRWDGSLYRISYQFSGRKVIGTRIRLTLIADIVDWLIGCKYGFIPYLQNNWTLHVSTIVTFWNYDYNLQVNHSTSKLFNEVWSMRKLSS